VGTSFLNLFFKEQKCNGVLDIFTEFFTSLAMDNAIPHISTVFTMFSGIFYVSFLMETVSLKCQVKVHQETGNGN